MPSNQLSCFCSSEGPVKQQLYAGPSDEQKQLRLLTVGLREIYSLLETGLMKKAKKQTKSQSPALQAAAAPRFQLTRKPLNDGNGSEQRTPEELTSRALQRRKQFEQLNIIGNLKPLNSQLELRLITAGVENAEAGTQEHVDVKELREWWPEELEILKGTRYEGLVVEFFECFEIVKEYEMKREYKLGMEVVY